MHASEWSSAWHVARTDLRLWLRDKGALFWSFLGPLIFTIFFGFMFKAPSGTERAVVYVNDGDTMPVVARAVAVQLQDAGMDVRLGKAPGDEYEVRVPAGAADSLAAGRVPPLAMASPNDNVTPREQTMVAEVVRTQLRTFLGLKPEDIRADLDSTTIRARVAMDPVVAMIKQELPSNQPSTGFQHSVPAYMVMFIFMNLFTYGAAFLIEERRAGRLRRVAVSTTTSRQIIAGKVVSRFLWSGIQMTWMVLLGVLFRISLGSHPEALVVVLVVLALCATALGILFATYFRNPDKAAGLGSLLVMAMAALGGCWWPLEIVPDWMRRIAFALPTGWGYDALNRIMALDATVPQVATHLLVLGGATAIALPIAIRRLRHNA
jgi:ABC-type multidrug transport system permease subunit